MKSFSPHLKNRGNNRGLITNDKHLQKNTIRHYRHGIQEIIEQGLCPSWAVGRETVIEAAGLGLIVGWGGGVQYDMRSTTFIP